MRHWSLRAAGKDGPRASNSFLLALGKIVVYIFKGLEGTFRGHLSHWFLTLSTH